MSNIMEQDAEQLGSVASSTVYDLSAVGKNRSLLRSKKIDEERKALDSGLRKDSEEDFAINDDDRKGPYPPTVS